MGLALGGGGARGLAHIPMLETLDAWGVRPDRIAGTSIGAVIGALYAAGRTGRQIRELIRRVIHRRGGSLRAALKKGEAFSWVKLFDFKFDRHGLLKGDAFAKFLYGEIGVDTFEELKTPLSVVATDFWTSEQVVLDSGPLMEAVKASMGLPGVFTPVRRGGRTLIDGGGVNPVPHDLLTDCDRVIAVDVMGRMECAGAEAPNLVRAVVGTFDIMQNSIIREKLRIRPPTVYIKPDIRDVDLLEFFKAEEIYRQAEPARLELERALKEGGYSPSGEVRSTGRD